MQTSETQTDNKTFISRGVGTEDMDNKSNKCVQTVEDTVASLGKENKSTQFEIQKAK